MRSDNAFRHDFSPEKPAILQSNLPGILPVSSRRHACSICSGVGVTEGLRPRVSGRSSGKVGAGLAVRFLIGFFPFCGYAALPECVPF